MAATSFWQLAGMGVQLAQMLLYLASVDEYKDKLEKMAEWLAVYADDEKEKYYEMRDKDPAFYSYYKDLPDYEVCVSAIKRSKGQAFNRYGTRLRLHQRGTRGYTPWRNITLNNRFAGDAINEAAVARAVTAVTERKRHEDHILERWSAIVSAPINQEGYQASIVNGIINAQFKGFKSASRGFNSAGASFGTSLFKVLS